MKKYLAGGKAVGSSASCASASGTNGTLPLASLLAQREAQDAMWMKPVACSSASASPASQQQQQQLVVVTQKKQSKQSDIDFILNGDFE